MSDLKSLTKSQRIAKVIARSGICSRRDAEKLILEGKVTVNEISITSPATNVCDTDKIKVEGKELPHLEKTKVWIFHKPKRTITSRIDQAGRQTIYDVLPKQYSSLITIGRLDYMTEGLLLLTNDGEFARYMELPKNSIKRAYLVRIKGGLDKRFIEKLSDGIRIEDIQYQPIQARVLQLQKNHTWVELILSEGKNREIRNIFSYFNLEILRLKRIGYGPFKLGKMIPAEIQEADPSLVITST